MSTTDKRPSRKRHKDKLDFATAIWPEISVSDHASLLADLYQSHSSTKLFVVSLTVSTEVNTTVTGRTETDDEPRVIWSTITHPSKVVWLQVRATISSNERSFLPATLTMCTRSGENVLTNLLTALKYCSIAHGAGNNSLCCGHSSGSKVCKGSDNGFSISLVKKVDITQSIKFENERLSHHPVRIRCLTLLNTSTNPFAEIAQRALLLFPKQQEAFPFARVLSNSEIAFLHLHGPDLTLPEIFKNTIVTETVSIAVLMPFFASYGNDKGMFSRCYDATLLLTAISGVDVLASIVEMPLFERPRHRSSLSVQTVSTIFVTQDCECGFKARLAPLTADKSPSRSRPGQIRDFLVEWCGHPDAHWVRATSAGGARYVSFLQARDVGFYSDFRLFLRDTRVRRPSADEVRA